MTNVAHASLTGASLHEPKGAATASAGQVYVASGSGSGAWTTVTGLSITGMVSDFMTPLAPTGWLELDGGTFNSSTYPALWAVITIQKTGNRTGGSKIISGLGSTNGVKAGFYVSGTGISNGTLIASVDTTDQITLDTNAGSTGSGTIYISPWAITNTTFTLPDMTSAGRYRRSRSISAEMGVIQAQDLGAHTHTGGTSANGGHSHTGITNTGGVDHTHTYERSDVSGGLFTGPGGGGPSLTIRSTVATSAASAYLHTHTFSTSLQNDHSHTFMTDSTGGSETRPPSVVYITCVKT